MYQALYRKWRPKTFDDVTGQEHVTKTLKTQTAQGRLSHAYLFTGTRGTGKTSCAKILAKAVNCQHPVDGNPCNVCDTCKGIDHGSILEVLELDAASNNGVEQIRALREEAIYSPAYCKKRVYIIDEVHMLSTAAFNALLKILEEPPEHLMFILATTELHKVPATILSRCQRFSFKRLLPAQIQRRLSFVAEQEHLSLQEEGASLLSRLADGSMRDALSLLDQCAGLGENIDAPFVLNVLGLAGNLETARLMEALGRRDAPGALEILAELYQGGREMGALLGALSGLARDILIMETTPAAAGLLTGGYETETLRRLARYFTPARLIQTVQLLQRTVDGFSKSCNRRTDGELCIIRLCDETLSDDLTGILARLSRLESAVREGCIPATPAPPPGETRQDDRPPVFPETEIKTEATKTGETDGRLPWEDLSPLRAPVQSDEERKRSVSESEAEKPRSSEMGESEREKSASKPDHSGGKPANTSALETEDVWRAIEGAMRKAVLMPAFAVLSNRTMVDFSLENHVLTVYTDTEPTRKLVGGREVEQALVSACGAQYGTPVTIRWQLKGERAVPKEKETKHTSASATSEPARKAKGKDNGDKMDALLTLCEGLDAVILD
ncbi:MAG: DNA polymerase III subunit gamma/tau [Oscillospiraceae bacterium]|jgi:DNA polymerase-3 subunit gamma/tau